MCNDGDACIHVLYIDTVYLEIAEYGVQKKFILTYGVVTEFTCKDFQPVHISVPAGRQLVVFSATYGSPNNDVTRAVINKLVKNNAVSPACT